MGWAPRRVPPSGWGGWDRHFPTPSWSPEMMGGGAGSLLVTPGPRASHPGGQGLSAQQGDPGSCPRTPTLMTEPPSRPRTWAGQKSWAVCSLLGPAPCGAGLVSGPRVLRTDGVGFAGPRAGARPKDTGFRVGPGLSAGSLEKGPHTPPTAALPPHRAELVTWLWQEVGTLTGVRGESPAHHIRPESQASTRGPGGLRWW